MTKTETNYGTHNYDLAAHESHQDLPRGVTDDCEVEYVDIMYLNTATGHRFKVRQRNVCAEPGKV